MLLTGISASWTWTSVVRINCMVNGKCKSCESERSMKSKRANAVKQSLIGLYSSSLPTHHTCSTVSIGWTSQCFQIVLENIAPSCTRILDVLFTYSKKCNSMRIISGSTRGVMFGLVWIKNTCSKYTCDLLWFTNVWRGYKPKRSLHVIELLVETFSAIWRKAVCYVRCLTGHIIK